MSYYFEVNRWGERYVPDVNRDTFKDRASADVYEQEFDLDLSTKDTLHIFAGSDSGLILTYLQRNLTAPGSCAIVIETDELTPYIADEYPEFTGAKADTLGVNDAEVVDRNPPRIRLVRAGDWQAEVNIRQYDPWFHKASVQLHRSHCCFTDYNNQYTKLFRDTRRSVSERGIGLQLAVGIKRFVKTQLLNAADNVTPVPGNSEFGRGKTAVVLAGGPSLSGHMDWILDNRDSLFIIAVSRLCNKLQELNLKPDLVVSVDPLANMYEVSKHGVLWDDVPLISSYHLAPQLLQEWQGPHYFIGERLPWDKFRKKTDQRLNETGPTVGHTGVIVASYLGFSTILLAGADFCFNSLGSTHVDGTPEAALRTLPSGYDAQIKTYNGRTAGTSLPLMRSVDAMEALGKLINSEETRLYNLSEEAARLASIPLIAKEDVVLGGDKPAFDASVPYAPTEASLKALGRELQDAKRAFKEVMDLCKKALVCVDYIYECKGRQSTPAHHKRLKHIETKITKHDLYTKVIKYLNTEEFLKLQTPAGFETMSKPEMETWVRAYYKFLKDGAKSLIDMIDSALDKTQLRKSELSKNRDVADLISRWIDDNTPGRVLLLEQTKDALTDVEKQLVSDALEQYKLSIAQTYEQSVPGITDTRLVIHNCINSVMFLFYGEHLDELTALSEAITDHSWPNNALVHFIDALKHELSDDRQAAAFCYQSALDACSDKLETAETDLHTVGRIVESALIRLTQCHLANNNGDEALQTLATLNETSHHFTCTYAKLLGVLGQPDAAIDQLQAYLEHSPADWRAAQQLSEHYRKIGAEASADLAVQMAQSTREANRKELNKAA